LPLREFTFSAQDRLQKENRGAGVAIFSDQPHVVTKGLDLGQSDDLNNSVFHLAGLGWENQLEQFVQSLSQSDLSSCMAIRYSAVEPLEPWRALSLVELVNQLSGQWFNNLLETNRIISHYQPIYNLKSCRVVGFEALARGVDSSGLRSGFELVMAADRLGLKTEFDRLARIAAITCLYNQLLPEELIFINLNPASFSNGCDDLHSAVFAMRGAGINPGQVVFEFVEADQFPSENALLNLVATIRESGAKIALDDFGSGHSTIAMAEIIRPDIIKFDRTLLQPTEDEAKEILLSSLVNFAKSLGAITVAEGIETMNQLALAERCGFELIQGWLVSKPAARLQRPKLALQKSLLDF
jgi:EAL domain-containing protein (putative c-di-GMP-specific phosphodiesterase class I)